MSILKLDWKKKLFKKEFFICVCAYVSLCVLHVCRCFQRPEEYVESPGTGVAGNCRIPVRVLEPEPPGSLQEQYQVLLTTELSL